METFSALLAICVCVCVCGGGGGGGGDLPVTGEFPTKRPGARSFDVVFDLRLNTRLSK